MNEIDKGFEQVAAIIENARSNAFPSFMKEYLQKKHIDVEHIITDERKQGWNYA